MITEKDTERASENIQPPFRTRTLSLLEMEGNFHSPKKDLYGQPKKSHTSWGNTEVPLSNTRNEAGISTLTTSI